jgi:drug/metabolite transporter (DMT)-like permease
VRDRSDFTTGVVAASLGMVGWAASGVIVKGIDLPALAVVFWRMTIYAVVIVAVLRLRGRPLTMRGLRISTPGGIALGLDIMLFFSAVKLTTVANATVIGAMQPVLMLGISGPMFGERPRRSDWMLAVVALGGVGLVLFGSAGIPEWSPVGDFLALLTLFAWTFYFVFSKKTRDRIDAVEYTAGTAVVATALAAPVSLLSGQVAEMPDGSAWFWLVVLALGPGFASHILVNWSLNKIPLWLGSTLTLAIPVASALLAWVFLGEQLVLAQVLGILVVTGALTGLVVKPAPPPVRQPVPDGQEQMFGPS